jgi:hypothetical protein
VAGSDRHDVPASADRAAGRHTVEVEYYQHGGGEVLQFGIGAASADAARHSITGGCHGTVFAGGPGTTGDAADPGPCALALCLLLPWNTPIGSGATSSQPILR